MRHPLNIAVVGTGYVGLVAGTCFADWGHTVVCVDRDAERIRLLGLGGTPIFEPGLEDLLRRTIDAGRIRFTTSIAEAVADADLAYIAVGTPPSPVDGAADLHQVFDVAGLIADVIRPNGVIVTKSTVPVGTGDAIEKLVRRRRPKAAIAVVSNPEFLREGSAILDFTRPDRVVIGAENDRAAELVRSAYEPIAEIGRPIVVTHRRSAELVKYAANAFLATKITFINEIADLCEAAGADVSDVALGIGLDSRIGPQFLQPGPGYGGSCFPKDTLALVRTAQELGVGLRLVEETVMANTARRRRMALKVRNVLHGHVEGKHIAVLGLTFKANTDDMRESPAIPMIELLQRSGASIRAYDPEGEPQARGLFTEVTYFDDPYRCVEGCDAVVFMTDWDQVKHLDLARLAASMRSPVMIDLRRIYSPEDAARQGFTVETIGRNGVDAHPYTSASYLVSHCIAPTNFGSIGRIEEETEGI